MSSLYLILFSIFGWGIGSLFYKVANDNMHPLMVSTIVTLVYIVMAPLPYFFVKFDHTINSTGIIFSVLGSICMAIGSIGYFYALKAGSAGSVTTLTALYPALTLLLSFLFMKEVIGLKQIIGIGFALISFTLLSQKN